MDSNREIDYRYLHHKLISNSLTREEKNDLYTKIQLTYKDQELDLLMREYWANLEHQQFDSEETKLLSLKNKILSRIKKNHKAFQTNWQVVLMRVAAILFIPLLLGSIFTIYRMNEKMENGNPTSTIQQVIASPGSRVHLFLPDKTEVWLNSASILEYPLNLNTRNQRKVKLYGQGYFNVAHDQKHPFFVETNDLNIKVLGTSFDVSSYANDKNFISTLEKGSVVLLNTCGREIGRLNPGQRAVLNKETKTLLVENVDTKLTTSWKDGKLIFRNTSLPDVARQMERWFNCKINIDPKLMNSNILYTATIQDETLGEVLKMIEISTCVKTKIEKREATIWNKN